MFNQNQTLSCTSVKTMPEENISRKRKNELQIQRVITEIHEKMMKIYIDHHEFNPLQPIICSRTTFSISQESDYKYRPCSNPVIIYHHPETLTNRKDFMACFLIGTGNIQENIIKNPNTFLPNSTQKYIYATSDNLVCCAGDNAMMGLKFINYFDLSYDLGNSLCVPDRKRLVSIAQSSSPRIEAGSNSSFDPIQFCQGICFPRTSNLQFEELYVTYGSSGEDTPRFEEELNTGLKLKAIIIFRIAEDRYINEMLKYRYDTEMDIQDWDVDNLFMIGGNVEDLGTSGCGSDVAACGWKVRANDEVSVIVYGISGWDTQNDPTWSYRRDVAIENAEIGGFFGGKENGFVFMMYEEGSSVKETIPIIHNYIPKHIPVLGIQVTQAPLTFLGVPIRMNYHQIIIRDKPPPTGSWFDRKDIKLVFLMVAY